MKSLRATIVATMMTMTVQAQDFQRLPPIYLLAQEFVISQQGKDEVTQTLNGFGSAWKIGSNGKRDFYISAGHLGSNGTVVPPGFSLVEEWNLYDDAKEGPLTQAPLRVEMKDEKADYFILSTPERSDVPGIPICEGLPELGEKAYVRGYYRGILALSEGRVVNQNIQTSLGLDDYLADIRVSKGASGSPLLLWRDDEFCAAGIVKGGLDDGILTIVSKLDEMLLMYEKVKAR